MILPKHIPAFISLVKYTTHDLILSLHAVHNFVFKIETFITDIILVIHNSHVTYQQFRPVNIYIGNHDNAYLTDL